MLLVLTLVTLALIVLVTIGYLAAIAWSLMDTRRSMAAMADGLESIQRSTRDLDAKLAAINGAMSSVRHALSGGPHA